MDFLQTVVTGHILASACNLLKIQRISQHPEQFASSLTKLKTANAAERKVFLFHLAEQVVQSCTINDAALTFQEQSHSQDHVYSYAQVLCQFGSLVMAFRDAWAEGDGTRILICWKVFMLHFYDDSTRSKYAFEAIRLLIQKEILPPHLSHDLVWNRFVNSHGGCGRNIPCDLFNEHVNKVIKDIIKNMGPNLTEAALQRAARSVSAVKAICSQFDILSHVPASTSRHSTRATDQDVGRVVGCVLNNCLLQDQNQDRQHMSFPSFSDNPLKRISRTDTLLWIEHKRREAIREAQLAKPD